MKQKSFRSREYVTKIFVNVQTFLRTESASGMILLACAAIAIWLANSDWASVYHETLAANIGPYSVAMWINDALMAVFFFVVGMEIKHELVDGALASFDRALLPVLAAVGGMVAPALIYVMINNDPAFERGWGIPMATDIAFAVGVLALLGKRVPTELKIFLLALAIVDDLGAILVIALFYTAGVNFAYLLAAVLCIAVIYALTRVKVLSPLLHIPLGILVWYLVHHSGVHATIAGCALGFLVPHSDLNPNDPTPLERWVHRLHPLVAFFIMPVFALSNAGVELAGVTLETVLKNPAVSAISYGLLIGKPVGIMLVSWAAVRVGLGRLPQNVSWPAFLGMGCLAGIGFTMALFVSNLAFTDPHAIGLAKIGIVKGSLISAVLGFALLTWTLKKPEPLK